MAYEMQTEGMAEISEMLSDLEDRAPAIAAQGLYQGAAEMQKAIRKEMDKVKTAPFKYAKNGEQRLPSPEEKEILDHAGVGVARFDRNGSEISTSVGFNKSEYADVNWNHMSSQARTNYKAQSFKGKSSMTTSTLKAAGAYKRGQQNQKPVGVVASSINSGTSFMKKQPFVRNGEKNGRQQAEKAMKDSIESAFKAIIKK